MADWVESSGSGVEIWLQETSQANKSDNKMTSFICENAATLNGAGMSGNLKSSRRCMARKQDSKISPNATKEVTKLE